MPIIGPVIGVLARAAASKVAQRGATAAAGRAASSAQFARGASTLARFGKTATTVGRGALLMSTFMGSGSSGSQAAPAQMPTESGPTKKQGLDTYGDGIY
jgi:hypothetical protein